MKLPQIIRFADYLKENPAEAVRTVLYQDQHDNMVLWQIPPGESLPAHRHPHGFDIWIGHFLSVSVSVSLSLSA